MVATRHSNRLASAPTPASPTPAPAPAPAPASPPPPPPPHAFGPGPTPSRTLVNGKRASENDDESDDESDDNDDEGNGSSSDSDDDNGTLHTAAATATLSTTAGGRLRDLTAPSSKRPRLAYTPAPLPDLPASDDDDPDPLGTTLHTLSKKSWGRVQSWFDAIAAKYAREFEDDAEIDFNERVFIDPHELWDTVDPAPLVFGSLSGLAPDEQDVSSDGDEVGEGDESPADGAAGAETTADATLSVTTTSASTCGTALYDADFTPIGDAVPRYTNVVTIRSKRAHRPHRFRPAPIDPPVHSLLPLERIMPSPPVADPPPPVPQYDEDMNPLPGVEPATPRLVVKLTPGRAYTPGRSSRSRRVTVDLGGAGASDSVLTPVPPPRTHQAVGATAASGSPYPTRDTVDGEERRISVLLPLSSPSFRRKRSRTKLESVK
ncbi:hypothetical protein AMAG_00375 [Allomyces macrogynus ATCC 38327]|uniref:Uncharacterized protein n=1 Tax=Allomyces macrogynus (strain ATCC 38327) TaxID=578462 RepID=A0A0L0RVQ8_ALLM3|nr:hypothetical protein AMAG_00375 [Allomyces macrogynus ATCC 38327]|eukprot:KNE54403.1 hypothetical protein AMAG_00375 [Allomyces macrogynus ATCC 38327]